MKVVDEKGKLFGKINVIDLLVIVLILAILAVIGLKVFGRENNPVNDNPSSSQGNVGDNAGEAAQTQKLTYTVRVNAQNKNAAEQLVRYVDADAGRKDQLVVGADKVDAYVVDYWTEPARYFWGITSTGSGTAELLDPEAAEAAGLVDICFVIEADVTEEWPNLVGKQDVRIGKSHIVKTAHMEFVAGIVENCVWEQVD